MPRSVTVYDCPIAIDATRRSVKTKRAGWCALAMEHLEIEQIRFPWPVLLPSILLPFCQFPFSFFCAFVTLVQPLQYGSHNDRQADRGIYEDLAKPSAFGRRNELAPRDRFAIGTARQSAPVHWLRAYPETVVIALQRQVLSAPSVPEGGERPKLLRPIARDAAANGENPKFLLPQKRPSASALALTKSWMKSSYRDPVR